MRDRPGTQAKQRLKAADAYRLWAPAYSEETAVSALEDRLARSVMPDPARRRLLDVGTGTGRRLRQVSDVAALAVGADLVPEMLRAEGPRVAGALRAAADVARLPFRDGTFDLVWCRLVIGHVEDLEGAYRELGRVSGVGADLLVSDFHAAAVAAGHTRTFRDSSGVVREIEHHARSCAEHGAAARAGGWSVTATVESPAGEPERPFYERAGRLAQLESERDLPLVMVMCLRR